MLGRSVLEGANAVLPSTCRGLGSGTVSVSLCLDLRRGHRGVYHGVRERRVCALEPRVLWVEQNFEYRCIQ